MIPELEILSTKSGTFCLFKNNDLIGEALRKNGVFAEKEVNLAIHFAKSLPGSTVLDIGSNIGAFAVPLANRLMEFGAGISIHCYEPQRTVFMQLCTNIFINRITNVYTHNVALGQQKEKISIPVLDFEKSKNPGGFSVDPLVRENLILSGEAGVTAMNYYSNRFEMVNQVPLDSISFDQPIAFIKLDVEGHELECLKGAVKTLKDNSFPPIVLEDWGSKFDWYREKSFKLRAYLTKELGYVLSSLGGRELLAQHPECPTASSEFLK